MSEKQPVRYELIDKDGYRVTPGNGFPVITFETAHAAGIHARERWPDQQQDPDRTGGGWDVQVAGVK